MDPFNLLLSLISLTWSFASVSPQYLTDEQLEKRREMLMPFCEEGFVLTPESVVFDRVPELSLKNAIEPKCLQRCLQTYERINFDSCEAFSECKQCMLPCLEPGMYGKDCTDFCGAANGNEDSGDGSEESSSFDDCMDSCEYYQTNYEEKSDMVCPDPYDVSKEDWMYRDECIELSDCYFDTQCKWKKHKCCPSKTDARFCVDMSPTGNHSALSFVDPDHYIDEFFNFLVEVQQAGKSLILSYRLQNKTLAQMLPERYTVALFVWRSSLNFKEEQDYRFHSFNSNLEGSFKFSMFPGFFHKFKMGIYDEYGLIGTKLDNLANIPYGLIKVPVIKKVPRMRIDRIFCEMDNAYSIPDCDISLSWSPVPDNEYPLLYNVVIDSCSAANPFEPISALKVKGRGLNICQSSFNVTIHAAAKINFPSGISEFVYSAPRTFSFSLASSECEDDGDNQEFGVTEAIVLATNYPKTQRMRLQVNESALFALTKIRKNGFLFVTIKEHFCSCRSDTCTYRAEFLLPVDNIGDIKFEVEAKNHYSISVYLVSSAKSNLCYFVGSHNKPPIPFMSAENKFLQKNIQSFFPMETAPFFSFPGKMRLVFLNINTGSVVQRLEFRSYDFPLARFPFITKCSSELYVSIYHQPADDGDESTYDNCADYGYMLEHVPFKCYTEEEYYRFFIERSVAKYIDQFSLYFIFFINSVVYLLLL